MLKTSSLPVGQTLTLDTLTAELIRAMNQVRQPCESSKLTQLCYTMLDMPLINLPTNSLRHIMAKQLFHWSSCSCVITVRSHCSSFECCKAHLISSLAQGILAECTLDPMILSSMDPNAHLMDSLPDHILEYVMILPTLQGLR